MSGWEWEPDLRGSPQVAMRCEDYGRCVSAEIYRGRLCVEDGRIAVSIPIDVIRALLDRHEMEAK